MEEQKEKTHNRHIGNRIFLIPDGFLGKSYIAIR